MVDVRGYGALLLKHINEHKWYLSEQRGREAPVEKAADHWYAEVFRPVCRLFKEHGLLSMFPEKSASTLYFEIMEHKYLLSEKEEKDVGLVRARETTLRGSEGKAARRGLRR